jgi:hypothetical protein
MASTDEKHESPTFYAGLFVDKYCWAGDKTIPQG